MVAAPLAMPTPPVERRWKCPTCPNTLGVWVNGWLLSIHGGREWYGPPGSQIRCNQCKRTHTVPRALDNGATDV